MDIFTSLQLKEKNSGASCGDGQWLKTNHATFTTLNPATGESLAEVVGADDHALETIIQASQHSFLSWRQVPAPKRGEVIRQLAEKLRQNKEALGALISLEMGKSLQEGKGEVQEMIDIAEFSVGLSRQLYGKTMHSERPYHRMYEQWHPLGPVGVITAFNFPMAVWAWNACIAAICGNTIIWKPSEKTPLCAIAVHHLCQEVMQTNACPSLFSIWIPARGQQAEKLVTDLRVPLISFTGSVTTGRHVAQLVAGRLGRSLLELGGNNAIILDEQCNLNLAIPAIVFGAIGTAGQRCTTTRRLLVPAKQFDDIVQRLKSAYAQVTIGDPLDTKNLMGPLIDAEAVQHYERAIAALKAAGGEVLYGGQILKRAGYFVMPTLCRAENSWPIVQAETFAPILYCIPYDTLDQALDMQNGVKQGLSSAVFTESLKTAEYFLSAAGSDCGIANVNIGTSGAEIGGAFGGEKETGGGREAGSDAWKAYMRRQTNTINWGTRLPLAQGIQFDLK
jgi:aldehyde dehydrogenase (NAD+)